MKSARTRSLRSVAYNLPFASKYLNIYRVRTIRCFTLSLKRRSFASSVLNERYLRKRLPLICSDYDYKSITRGKNVDKCTYTTDRKYCSNTFLQVIKYFCESLWAYVCVQASMFYRDFLSRVATLIEKNKIISTRFIHNFITKTHVVKNKQISGYF